MRKKMEPAKSRHQLWQDTIDQSQKDPRWHDYDCDIKRIVREFNQHLSGQGGYRPLDWRLIKAIIWTESGGPDNRSWKRNPMQIGNPGDPGLRALLSGDEGGDLILPPELAKALTESSARSTPQMNIRAGTAYLLMRLARFNTVSVMQVSDSLQTVEARRGDTLSKIARVNGTTVEVLKSLNREAMLLNPGMTLKFKKAAMRKMITGWDQVTTSRIAQRYNVGDPGYAGKLNYCLSVMKNHSEVAPCAA
jgi:hypothetical protein